MWRTIRLLFRNPGHLFNEYLDGKRKSYYQPVAFFIVMTALYIVLRALISFDPLAQQTANSQMNESTKIFFTASRFMVNNINSIMFTLVLSIGLMLKLFFNSYRNLAEYLVVGFYIAGIYILLSIPLMFAIKLGAIMSNQYQLLLMGLYFYYSFWSLFKRKSFTFHLIYLFASFLSILLYMVLGYSTSLVIVWIFGIDY